MKPNETDPPLVQLKLHALYTVLNAKYVRWVKLQVTSQELFAPCSIFPVTPHASSSPAVRYMYLYTQSDHHLPCTLICRSDTCPKAAEVAPPRLKEWNPNTSAPSTSSCSNILRSRARIVSVVNAVLLSARVAVKTGPSPPANICFSCLNAVRMLSAEL